MKATLYMRKPFFAIGFTVTEENMETLARWCKGQVQQDEERAYIWVPAENARHRSQTEANIGDTILKSRREDRRKGGDRFIFKIYRAEWLDKEFDSVDRDEMAFLLDDEIDDVNEADPSPAPRSSARPGPRGRGIPGQQSNVTPLRAI